ncbi:hypothetical protein HPB47_014919 [Ixodes persulcatus]|uniref:Uncharacterized protein n=1 Tax=Ixodes persulcatus TaxID=34615 RepID=A0AC60QWN4_IXOPE|nr:hypothetical protein HPB47_014919 [Ixodes persulcatus]
MHRGLSDFNLLITSEITRSLPPRFFLCVTMLPEVYLSASFRPVKNPWRALPFKIPRDMGTLKKNSGNKFYPQRTRSLGKFALHTVSTFFQQALVMAAGLTPGEMTDSMLQVQAPQNILAFKTLRPTAAAKILDNKHFVLNNRDHPYTSYTAAPTLSCKGVIHGVEASTPEKTLQRHLIPIGANTITARMLGRTKSVLITFEGTYVPKIVCYGQAEFRCYPHRPKAQFCSRCHLLGHRADVCASPPDTILCAHCSTPLNSTNEPHDCHVRCKTCSGDHPTTSSQCPPRLQANAQAVKQAYERRIQLRKTTAQDLTKQKPPSARQHRPRSRSRTPARRPTTPRPKTPSKVRGNPAPNSNPRRDQAQPNHLQQLQSRTSSSPQQVSQPLPPHSPSPDHMSDSTTPLPASASYRNALAPPSLRTTQPSPTPTQPITNFETLFTTLCEQLAEQHEQRLAAQDSKNASMEAKLDRILRLLRKSRSRSPSTSTNTPKQRRDNIPQEPPPWNILPNIQVEPIPRNMDPDRNKKRRELRARALTQRSTVGTDKRCPLLPPISAAQTPHLSGRRRRIHCHHITSYIEFTGDPATPFVNVVTPSPGRVTHIGRGLAPPLDIAEQTLQALAAHAKTVSAQVLQEYEARHVFSRVQTGNLFPET